MQIKCETWVPSHETRMLDLADIPLVYRDAKESASPTFTWNDLGDEVLIVVVGDDYSTVTLMREDTFYNLAISDSVDMREIQVSGDIAMWPEGQVLPRELGLEVLLRVPDVESLVREYRWEEQ
ncbi:hypothetical protein SAMN05216268_120128 [Streptomyces yunnanensis]|uniref:Uncharacterized protein n=2 Tax=Streptomyces TaxID=1883 RepID=A0A9X8N644_9ACTN|nr:hypothetical protein SAMN05216268_120128 [Streptomyces yunnanensis]